MMEGWWTTFAFSGLSLSFGALVWLLWRDRERRRREKEKAFRRILREAREDEALSAQPSEKAAQEPANEPVNGPPNGP